MSITVVTMDRELNERMGWYTYMVRVNGIVVCGITDQTGEAKANKFFELCQLHATEVQEACVNAEERREWNMAHEGQGRDWPAFKIKERLVARLLKEAGIRNT